MELPDLVRSGVEALRAGRAGDAAAALRPVFADADLAADDDLRDIRLRVCTLLGQALLAIGASAEAEAVLAEGAALAEALGDEEGRAAVEELRAQAATAAMERHREAAEARARARLADTPLERLLEAAKDPRSRADVMLRKAQAEIEAGRPAVGAAVAREALAVGVAAGGVREEVLARLMLARAEPEGAAAQLEAALDRATGAGEFNLVGAVAKTAELVGLPVPAQPFAGRRVGSDR